MIDKLIEGKLVTLIVGSVFRLVEIFVRAIHLTVRGIDGSSCKRCVTSRIDTWLSAFGKRMVANSARVDHTSIVLIESAGEYTGDPKYIAEEILRRGAPYKITWVLRDRSIGPFPSRVPLREVRHRRYFRVAGAKVVIQNAAPCRRAVSQEAARDPCNEPTRRTSKGWPRPSHWLDVPKLMLGHARNDILRRHVARRRRTRLRKKVLDRLDITDTGQKFLLYAPTRGGRAGAASLSGIDFALSARHCPSGSAEPGTS